MVTAIKLAIGLDPVADNLAPAVRARRCQLVNRALETVEHMSLSGRDDLKRPLILVSADLAL
jgi:hypothetical protein